MNVLALDIAGRFSGACVGDVGGAKPRFATLEQSLDGSMALGPAFHKFRRWMRDMIAVHGPIAHCAFEAPWMPMGNRSEDGKRSGMTSPRIPRLLLGMVAVAEELCEECGIPCSEAEVSSVRKFFIGTGRPAKPKSEVAHKCALLGWYIRNDHEGDAAALWAYTQSCLNPAYAANFVPLFAGATR